MSSFSARLPVWVRSRLPRMPGDGRAALRTALKTGLAAACAYLAGQFLPGRWVFLGCISVVAVMTQQSMGGVLRRSRERVAWAVLGAGLGIPALLATHGAGPAFWTLFGVAAFLSVYLRTWNWGAGFAALSMAIVLLLGAGTGGSGWMVGVHRVLAVTLGAFIGAAFASLLWPQRAGRRLDKCLAGGIHALGDLFEILSFELSEGLPHPGHAHQARIAVAGFIAQCETLVTEARVEPGSNVRGLAAMRRLAGRVRRFYDLMLSLESSLGRAPLPVLRERAGPELETACGAVSEAFAVLTDLVAGREASPFPDLNAALAPLAERLDRPRVQGDINWDSLMAGAVLEWHFRALALELTRAAAEWQAPDQGPGQDPGAPPPDETEPLRGAERSGSAPQL